MFILTNVTPVSSIKKDGTSVDMGGGHPLATCAPKDRGRSLRPALWARPPRQQWDPRRPPHWAAPRATVRVALLDLVGGVGFTPQPSEGLFLGDQAATSVLF